MSSTIIRSQPPTTEVILYDVFFNNLTRLYLNVDPDLIITNNKGRYLLISREQVVDNRSQGHGSMSVNHTLL